MSFVRLKLVLLNSCVYFLLRQYSCMLNFNLKLDVIGRKIKITISIHEGKNIFFPI